MCHGLNTMSFHSEACESSIIQHTAVLNQADGNEPAPI